MGMENFLDADKLQFRNRSTAPQMHLVNKFKMISEASETDAIDTCSKPINSSPNIFLRHRLETSKSSVLTFLMSMFQISETMY